LRLPPASLDIELSLSSRYSLAFALAISRAPNSAV